MNNEWIRWNTCGILLYQQSSDSWHYFLSSRPTQLTWYSPNLRDKNRIDLFIIDNLWRRLDVMVKRGADIESDHQLLKSVFKPKIRTTGKRFSPKKRFDVDKLQKIKVNRFRTDFNFWRILMMKRPTRWQNIKEIITSTGEDCLCCKQNQNRKNV